MAKGIDVYTAYQTVTDWSAVKRSGYEFVYVKVSDGTSTRVTNNYGPRARAAGIKTGAYHYAQPGNAIAQANLLVDQAVANGLTDLAPALDLESPFIPGTAAANFAIAFLKQVKARGHRPCIYGNNSMLEAVLPAVKAAVPDVLVWVARYGGSPTVSYDLWQHSQSGVVPGIRASSVDLNTGSVPLNTVAGPNPLLNGADMSDAYPQPKLLDSGAYRYHVTFSNWDKVNGRYLALSTGFTGCSFQIWIQLSDGSYVNSTAQIPSGSYNKVLNGTLAPDNVHWIGIPAGTQSVSVEILPSNTNGVPGVTVFTDGK